MDRIAFLIEREGEAPAELRPSQNEWLRGSLALPPSRNI
jgi:hypothetical protein